MDLFAHRIHKATFMNGVVRLECSMVTLDADGKIDPDAPVRPEQVTYALHVPLQGFMRSLKEMMDLANKLREDGVLKGEGGGRPGGQAGQRDIGSKQAGRSQRSLQDLSEEDRNGGSDQIV
jgi:hypothetical protein